MSLLVLTQPLTRGLRFIYGVIHDRVGKSILVSTFAFVALAMTVAVATVIRVTTVLVVLLTHPIFSHKIDLLTTGVISPTIFRPVLLVSGWHVQIDRLLVMRYR